MAISKKQRKLVWDKSGGLCWYCGDPLKPRWHVDHIEPVERKSKYVKTGNRTCKIVSTGEMRRPELDTLANMVPSCPQCNNFKFTFTVEQFRGEIEKQKERVLKYSTGAKMASKFGIIQVIDKPVKFWFELNGVTDENS